MFLKILIVILLALPTLFSLYVFSIEGAKMLKPLAFAFTLTSALYVLVISVVRVRHPSTPYLGFWIVLPICSALILACVVMALSVVGH
ncbi:putative membrane protein [Sorangium cellulosum So ce56]|uniref:Membrane protein n=1 Tax=Sorangium cellulosum (strain So ce56) TaxID=448385 RepID=A9GJD9_SORC5|nr:hypothetical protein [Sorangium cellulosum]CAN93392.1 putative membrane protein [Sorangium cellulosum So ce56]